jgi:cytochrome d ubiquinol oxidase subunit I
MKIAVIFGFITSLLELMPFGHEHARQVAHTQPEKFAAIEGLYTTQSQAPLVFFAIPFTKPPELKAKIELSGLLSWMAFGDVNAQIKGINEFPQENIPPLWMTFVSFHNMVVLGMYFIAVTFYSCLRLRKNKLFQTKWLLRLFVCSIPLPLAACQLGWITAEVGRQPWIVYGLLKTAHAHSTTVTASDIVFSIILFSIIYLLLGILYIYLLVREVHHGPQQVHEEEL